MPISLLNQPAELCEAIRPVVEVFAVSLTALNLSKQNSLKTASRLTRYLLRRVHLPVPHSPIFPG